MKKRIIFGAALIVASIGFGTMAAAASSALGPIDNGNGTATGYWLEPAGGTWPQTAVDPDACVTGTPGTIQVDIYPYASANDQARTNALWADQKLTEGEDYGWAQSWSFITQPVCATETETPSSPVTPSQPVTTPPSTGAPTPPPTTSTQTPTTPVSTPVVTAPPTTSTPSSPTGTPSSTPTAPSTTASTAARPSSTCSKASSTTSTCGHVFAAEKATGSLAYTGSESAGPFVALAFLLLAGGVVLIVLPSRRKADR